MPIDAADFLSYSVASRTQGRLEVAPSPVLELAYSTFFLSSPDFQGELGGLHEPGEASWARALYDSQPELLAELRAFSQEGCRAGFELLVGACQLGYARDADPSRFLADLPRLPERLMEEMAEADGAEGMRRNLGEQLARLSEAQAMHRYSAALHRLWEALAPLWTREGEATVRRECARFERSLMGGEGVLGALPRHHFTRFEHSTAEIGRYLEEGIVLVTPLFFAAGGGFLLDVKPTLYLGYGLHSDASYERLKRRVQRAASKGKGFADPTRLMILALIGEFEVTVGDLVAQLEVSQPTVSGHLKLLKEEGLVTLRKEGNKSYYKIAADEVAQVLEELKNLLCH